MLNPSQLSMALNSQLTLGIYDATKDLSGGGTKTGFVPGRGKP